MIESLPQIESLLKSLIKADDVKAVAAAKALAGFGADSVKPLVNALDTDDKKFRDTLVWILTEIGTSAIQSLVPLLKTGTSIQKTSATEILGTLAAPEATEYLINALKDDDPEVRNGAAWALVRIGAPAVASLIVLLNDKSTLIRDTAVWCLVGMGEKAVRPLVESLAKSHEPTRKIIIGILVDIKESAVASLIDLLSSPEWDIRVFAAEALGKIGDTRAIDALASSLGSDDREVRLKCVEALSEFRETAFPALSGLLISENSELRDDVFSVFGMCRRASVKVILDLLDNGDADIRRRAVRTLGIIKDAASFDRLTAALHDGDCGVRDMAAWALGELEDPRAEGPLLEALGDVTLDARYAQPAWALARFRSPGLTEKVVALLHHQADVIRWRAAMTLSLFHDNTAVSPLLQALSDEKEYEIRRRIIMTLGDIGDIRAIEPLTGLLIDDDGSYLFVIKETLQKIRSGRFNGSETNAAVEEPIVNY